MAIYHQTGVLSILLSSVTVPRSGKEVSGEAVEMGCCNAVRHATKG